LKEILATSLEFLLDFNHYNFLDPFSIFTAINPYFVTKKVLQTPSHFRYFNKVAVAFELSGQKFFSVLA
jgi:hypothetical protein